MSNNTIPSAYVKSVLQNGVGRYVCQLQRLTFIFCKSFGASRGMREFIEKDLVDFARANPGVVVYLHPRRHHSPYLSAEYLNSGKDFVSCHNYTREEISKYVEHLRTKSGFPYARLRKYWHTDSPSIQGVWTPFVNMDPRMNVVDFPDPDSSLCPPKHLSATDIVKRMAELEREGRSVDDPEVMPPNFVTKNVHH